MEWLLYICMVLFVIGLVVYTYQRVFAKRVITVVMDEGDNESFHKFMDILRSLRPLGGTYDDTTDVIRMEVTVMACDYDKALRSIKKLTNAEVI